MAQAASHFDRALGKGLDTPVLASILALAGAESDARVGEVSRAFRKALEVLKGRVCSQLSAGYLEESSREDNTAPERLQKKFNDTIEEHRRWMAAPTPYAMVGFPTFYITAEKITQLKDKILGEEDAAIKNARSAALCRDLTRWEGERQTAIYLFNQKVAIGELYYRNNPMPALYKSLKKIIAKEALSESFLRATRDLNPEQTPRYHTRRLAAFNRQLREVAAVSSENARFAQLPPDSFSPERFLRAEGIAIAAQDHIDRALVDIGDAIARIPGPIAGLPPLPHIGAAIPDIPAAWRLWFNNEANRPHINRLTYLALHCFPPELWRCTNLHSLEIRGGRNYLTQLPDELEQLPHLASLGLFGHRFGQVPLVIERLNLASLTLMNCQIEELPAFLADLPDLSYLDVRGNRIRELPDAIYRNVTGRRFPYLFSQGEIQIDRERLTRIPFRLWFRERFAIRFPDDRNTIVFFLALIPYAIYNFLLMEVVERIVTLCRDICECDREVDVEPQVVDIAQNAEIQEVAEEPGEVSYL